MQRPTLLAMLLLAVLAAGQDDESYAGSFLSGKLNLFNQSLQAFGWVGIFKEFGAESRVNSHPRRRLTHFRWS